MLTSLRLGNFKAFADTQQMPVKPLTLLFGANSSGKSSILHGLLLARHALETGELDAYRTAIGGESVDLGGFRQYVHRRDPSRRVEWSVELDVAGLQGRLAELLAPVFRVGFSVTLGMQLDDTGRPVRDAVPAMMTYDLYADRDHLLRMSRRPSGYMQLDRIAHRHRVFHEVLKALIESATTTESFTPADFESIEETIEGLVPSIQVEAKRILPGKVLHADDRPEVDVMLFPISRGNRREDLAGVVRQFFPRILNEIIQGLNQAIEKELSRLRYLGPLRSYPPRHLAFAQYHDPNWTAGGGYAWDMVRQDPTLRAAVNAWLNNPDRLKTPYELVVRDLISAAEAKEELLRHIESNYEGGYFDEGGDYEKGMEASSDMREYLDFLVEERFIEVIPDLFLIDRRTNTTVSHRDIGIGISQVLPVLVNAYAHENSLIAIEQPEIHLHPGLQAELGDVFIESAFGERRNTFILETHSEHLILRVLRRIRETSEGNLADGSIPVKPEDVCVVYAKATPNGTQLIDIPVTPDGDFGMQWPEGFFEERAEELF